MGKGVSIQCKRCDYSATLFEGDWVLGLKTSKCLEESLLRKEMTA
ncbi:hypothetical protein [Clostridium tertium]